MAPPGQQRVARAAARYRPGKAPLADQGDLSDSDASQHDGQRDSEPEDLQITSISQGTAALAAKRKTAGVIIDEGRKLDLKLQEKESSSEYETDSDQEEAPPAKPVFRAPGKIGTMPKAAPEPAEESSEYETESEESSEEEERAPMLKPVFVPKRQRETLDPAAAEQRGPEDEEQKAAALGEARRQESHRLAAERIKKELAEKEQEEAKPDLDDTDGKDPEEEFAQWRVRELERIQRDRQAAEEKRLEKEEVERRREMPEQERLKEDLAKAKKSRDEKQKGQQGFMQKYYHKGSYFQDMDILKRDYTEKTESAVDISQLPKIMQVRNYGKASRSKWTHLANEDTSRLGQDLNRKEGKGCFNCGGDHIRKDCPQLAGASGANAAPIADSSRRRPEERPRDDGYRSRRPEEDRYRSDDRERSRRDDRRSGEDRRSRGEDDDRRGSRDRRRDEDRHRERRSRDDRDRHRSRSPDRRR